MSSDRITTDDVRHVALLSRLYATDEEIEEYARALNPILGYFNKLGELDTGDIPPSCHSIPMKNVFRKDEVKPSLSNEEAVANAPESEEGCFKVPKIIQEP